MKMKNETICSEHGEKMETPQYKYRQAGKLKMGMLTDMDDDIENTAHDPLWHTIYDQCRI